MSDRISWNSFRGTATSGIWNMTKRPRLTEVVHAAVAVGLPLVAERQVSGAPCENVGDEVAFVQPLLCRFHFASLYGGTGSSNPVRSTPEEVLRRRWRLVD
jgi:hypothetical protein